MFDPRQLMTDIVLANRVTDSGRSPHGADGDRGFGESDADLLIGISRGDADSLAEVYERHCACVHGLAGRLCEADDAVGVTRQVFLAMWESPETIDTTAGTLCSVLRRAARVGALACSRS